MLTRRLIATAMLSALALSPRAARANFTGSPQDDLKRAAALFEEDKFDEATYWYYRGHYRMTALIAARPDTPGDKGVNFMWEISRELDILRKIAYGDINKLTRIIDRVLSEAKNQDDAHTPKAQFPGAHAKAFAELKEIRDRIWKDRRRIRAERARDGLVNR